jgi:hypothetical protein
MRATSGIGAGEIAMALPWHDAYNTILAIGTIF